MTIFALASGRGKAGVAVVRLSGPDSGDALRLLIGDEHEFPAPRRAVVRELRDPAGGGPIDRAMVIWFPAPGSFTGEDVVEFHVHGGRAVIERLAEALLAMPGIRIAEPGEFSRRAFENGKMDLTEAEGLADLVNAETEAQRRQALRQQDGELGRLYENWRGALIAVMARIEAGIDFSDQDLPPGVFAAARAEIERLHGVIAKHLDDGGRGERLREGVYCAIVGPPNVGKSSLFNLLARRDVAIVSDIPGTTRDVLEVHLDLGGVPVIVADTAGLRDSGDEVEAEGVRRALTRAEQADIVLVLWDEREKIDKDSIDQRVNNDNVILVMTKIDLLEQPLERARREIPGAMEVCRISNLTGEGVANLVAVLETAVGRQVDNAGAPALTRQRHRVALEACVRHLGQAAGGECGRELIAEDLIAEDLRMAARALGRITGRVDVEDILDTVFAEFCIGK